MIEIATLREKYIGVTSPLEDGTEPVERGAVRRHAQACLDENPIYAEASPDNEKFGGVVAPPLFPPLLFRRRFGAPDPIQAHARDPDYDGSGGARGALPEIPELRGMRHLNGGTEIEFFRYASHGEALTRQSRYVDFFDRETSKGRMIFVISETEYRTRPGELLLRTRSTAMMR